MGLDLRKLHVCFLVRIFSLALGEEGGIVPDRLVADVHLALEVLELVRVGRVPQRAFRHTGRKLVRPLRRVPLRGVLGRRLQGRVVYPAYPQRGLVAKHARVVGQVDAVPIQWPACEVFLGGGVAGPEHRAEGYHLRHVEGPRTAEVVAGLALVGRRGEGDRVGAVAVGRAGVWGREGIRGKQTELEDSLAVGRGLAEVGGSVVENVPV